MSWVIFSIFYKWHIADVYSQLWSVNHCNRIQTIIYVIFWMRISEARDETVLETWVKHFLSFNLFYVSKIAFGIWVILAWTLSLERRLDLIWMKYCTIFSGNWLDKSKKLNLNNTPIKLNGLFQNVFSKLQPPFLTSFSLDETLGRWGGGWTEITRMVEN